MNIKDGAWYECEGGCVYQARKIDMHTYRLGGYTVNASGTGYYSGKQIVLREVTVTPVLPFTLRAGGKYETVKPDGTPGPVVELQSCEWCNLRMKTFFPFAWRPEGMRDTHYVTADGDVISDFRTDRYRIVAEHREPTPLEKLEALCRRIIDGNDEKLNAELDACIAAVKGAK